MFCTGKLKRDGRRVGGKQGGKQGRKQRRREGGKAKIRQDWRSDVEIYRTNLAILVWRSAPYLVGSSLTWISIWCGSSMNLSISILSSPLNIDIERGEGGRGRGQEHEGGKGRRKDYRPPPMRIVHHSIIHVKCEGGRFTAREPRKVRVVRWRYLIFYGRWRWNRTWEWIQLSWITI